MNSNVAIAACLLLSTFVSMSASGMEKAPASVSLNLYEKSDATSVIFRQMLSEDTAASIGFMTRDHKSRISGQVYDAYELVGAYRKYLATTGLRHYAEGEVRVVSVEYDGSLSDYKGKGGVLGLYYGLEYFLAKHFSLDGRAGVEHIYVDYDNEGSSEVTDIPNARLGMNFYW